MSELSQTITLVLADGRRITACVPAFCASGDALAVTAIEVGDPTPLPDGCHWEHSGLPVRERP
jgi:hypothetical protein